MPLQLLCVDGAVSLRIGDTHKRISVSRWLRLTSYQHMQAVLQPEANIVHTPHKSAAAAVAASPKPWHCTMPCAQGMRTVGTCGNILTQCTGG